jgi:NADH:ubiquinone oxidoreductase subunit 6 (subunit J)
MVKALNVLKYIGLIIITIGIAIMLSSLAYKPHDTQRQIDLNGGLAIGIIGSIILILYYILYRTLTTGKTPNKKNGA